MSDPEFTVDPDQTEPRYENAVGYEARGPQYVAPDEEFDHTSQDLSTLGAHRRVDCILFGVRFRFSDPETYQDAQQLITATADFEVLCRRALAILVDDPAPISEVIEQLTPWQASLLAIEALTWARVEEYIDEIDDTEAIRKAAEDAWS
ncbi:hypothetical protein [Halomarina oriensis]|uniref:Uncharacterized protein n=1 Tax=Halomarina oriensis TaxID=671145 RepID=A0A6B0GWD4_9EURY|nr:hypothetical protein [Halomarina oriensis]MWG36455.1 hypothetical protein [Halomarina oriensis]